MVLGQNPPDKIPPGQNPTGQNRPGQNPPITFYIKYSPPPPPLPSNSKHFLSESVHYFIRILKHWGIEMFTACP